jgi:hypothetical protein
MRSITVGLCAAASAAVLLAGCQGNATPAAAPEDASAAESHGHGHGDDHDHGSTGPHGGALVELGDEEYHAEVVLDEVGGVATVYILDASAKSAVPIDAADVVINLARPGQPGAEHRLPASPREGDPEGKSSRFASSNAADLVRAMRERGAKPRLRVTIDGKPFNGAVPLDGGRGDAK